MNLLCRLVNNSARRQMVIKDDTGALGTSKQTKNLKYQTCLRMSCRCYPSASIKMGPRESEMKPKIKRVLAALRLALEPIYGERLERLILFGSQARGAAESESDTDVMVVLRGEVNPGKEIGRTGKAVTSLSLEYDAVISCVFVSSRRYATEQTPLLLNVRSEGVSV